jgi:murein DD-endopeptidase MepM/ murein hydrolase activator NlpD
MGRGTSTDWHRRALAWLLAVASVASFLVVGVGGGEAAAVSDADIEAAQRRVDDARRQARDAAVAYLRAEHELADIEDDLAELAEELPRLRARVDAAQDVFDENAVALYTGGGAGGDVASGLFSAQDTMDVGRVTTLAESSTARASDSLDELRDAQAALEAQERRTRERRDDQRRVTAEVKEQANVLAFAMRVAARELRKLQAQQAVEEYWAAVQRQEAARRAAEAAEAARRAADPTAPPEATPGVGTAPGRRSGPANPDDAADVPVEDLLCPIDAPVTFVNDWGQPRSNWRVHEGTDVFAERGTPNVAIADGVVIRRPGNLAGNGLRLVADDGHMYFYAHLERYEGDFDGDGERRVKKGDVVGYTGNTGNASGGPIHTHFEIHPKGGAPVNPYPWLRQMCAVQLGEEPPAQ